MIKNTLFNIPFGGAEYTGAADEAVKFTMEHQLLDEKLWRDFVEVYRHPSDDCDLGWRNEYWGKMMRGACLTYMYNGSDALYTVLENCVKDLLSVETDNGAFTTYSREKQFSGWDMWGRKYILTGLAHFLVICKDDALKDRIIEAMKKHADRVIENIGEGGEKKPITETSNFWLGVNSCSILEPFIELYKLTSEKRYLDFAEYVIHTGGCSGGDLIRLAYEDKLKPYEYPETKAYETMSFFEGVLAYYEVTGNEYYFEAVKKFVNAVSQTDVTLIGCCGCTHELFDNSAEKQTEYSEGIMQETCVTVTWMRLNARLYMLTGEEKYYAPIEISGLNALYGAINEKQHDQFDMHGKEFLPPLPFDSYSPLYNNNRGRGIGGLKYFDFGGHYGCCACIASAGVALVPLTAFLRTDDGFVFSSYNNGQINAASPDGIALHFTVKTEYPSSLNTTVKLSAEGEAAFALKFRIPFSDNAAILINGEEEKAEKKDGFVSIRRIWKDGDEISLKGDFSLALWEKNGKSAFTFGPITLARDSEKENEFAGFEKTVPAKKPLEYRIVPGINNEMLRLSLTSESGKDILLTDYASCGKAKYDSKSPITVWMNM